ncbi:MAG: type IV pilin N-terminal domain-containing protein [Thermoplasmata archaeon]
MDHGRRGVSDVVGTLLLLEITVALFASIVVIVNQFPRPPSQPFGQFEATLTCAYTGVGANGSRPSRSHGSPALPSRTPAFRTSSTPRPSPRSSPPRSQSRTASQASGCGRSARRGPSTSRTLPSLPRTTSP